MNGTRARIRDLVFEGGEGGHGFFIQDLTGWFERPDMRRENKKRQQAAGSHRSPGYADDRLIVIEGDCRTDSAEEQGHFARRLSGLLEDGGYARLTVDHEGMTLWCDVGLVSQSFDVEVYGSYATYQVQFIANDPYLYGETHRFPENGSVGPLVEVPMWHYGNARAYPRFVVGGNVTEDYAVYGPGSGGSRKRYKVNGTVTAPVVDTIDLSDGTVLRNSAIRRGVVEDATTWGIPGGTVVNHTLDSNGDPAVFHGFVTDTYI